MFCQNCGNELNENQDVTIDDVEDIETNLNTEKQEEYTVLDYIENEYPQEEIIEEPVIDEVKDIQEEIIR